MENTTLNEINTKLSSIQYLMTLSNIGVIVKLINICFNDEKKILAYKLTDGTKSSRDIGIVVGVSHKTITVWWKDWAKYGLLQFNQERPLKVLDIEELINISQFSKFNNTDQD